ncbi:hypothetical protein Q73A0000_15375 [Kaistella flava (ex Peng et al. 2021)]|uniref:Uncharacterized protein n=1 Tax=Kaistella flava (ex Peng et al. 2021) TaxID=2038776 RepID=A0A7M2YDF0_9FLAO|nr:hypothetical protein Q73A0000_15375 [Kaistella flava (ex Peng et al. 2021)]
MFIASSKPDKMETDKRLVISVLNRNKQTNLKCPIAVNLIIKFTAIGLDIQIRKRFVANISNICDKIIRK